MNLSLLSRYAFFAFCVLFTLASFWAMLRMVERRRLRDSALLGVMLGLALAPKVTVLPLLAPLALAYAYRVLDEVDGRFTDIVRTEQRQLVFARRRTPQRRDVRQRAAVHLQPLHR